MKLLNFFIPFIISSINCFSQQMDTVKISQIADSVIMINTSQDFLDYLLKNDKRVTKYEWIPSNANIDYSKINDKAYIKGYVEFKYMVNYDFTLPDGEMFRIKDDTIDCVFWSSPLLSVSLDSSYNIIETPDFSRLQKIYNRLQNTELIKKDTSIYLSQEFFDFKEKDTEAVLEYDILNDILYWRCTKIKDKRYLFRKTFTEFSYEHVLINAENGNYICNEIRNPGIGEKTKIIVK